MGFETTEEIMAEEMEKQRRKLREITQTLDQQHQMLRLIVQVQIYRLFFGIWSTTRIRFIESFEFQKMEIKTEADDVDEGVSPNELRAPSATNSTGTASRWTSPRIRKKLKHAKSFNKSA